jgi:hypothetical protein
VGGSVNIDDVHIGPRKSADLVVYRFWVTDHAVPVFRSLELCGLLFLVYRTVVCIPRQTAIISVYRINRLIFITETEVCLLRGTNGIFKPFSLVFLCNTPNIYLSISSINLMQFNFLNYNIFIKINLLTVR